MLLEDLGLLEVTTYFLLLMYFSVAIFFSMSISTFFLIGQNSELKMEMLYLNLFLYKLINCCYCISDTTVQSVTAIVHPAPLPTLATLSAAALLPSAIVKPQAATASDVAAAVMPQSAASKAPSAFDDDNNDAGDGGSVADVASRVLPIFSTVSNSSLASFHSVISMPEVRRSPRQVSKPSGWYLQLHKFGKLS